MAVTISQLPTRSRSARSTALATGFAEVGSTRRRYLDEQIKGIRNCPTVRLSARKRRASPYLSSFRGVYRANILAPSLHVPHRSLPIPSLLLTPPSESVQDPSGSTPPPAVKGELDIVRIQQSVGCPAFRQVRSRNFRWRKGTGQLGPHLAI